MSNYIPLDFFYNSTPFDTAANDVRNYLVENMQDALFMYFTLIGSGYLKGVIPDMEDQDIQSGIGYDGKIIDRLKKLEEDKGINTLLHDTNLDYEYKYADGYQDKLAIVALAIYKASV